jgi:cobalt-zinc-cadmium efflux system protein
VHVWTITSGLDAMSAHLSVNQNANVDQVLDTVTKICQEKFNLKHTTIQIEQASCQTDACH